MTLFVIDENVSMQFIDILYIIVPKSILLAQRAYPTEEDFSTVMF